MKFISLLTYCILSLTFLLITYPSFAYPADSVGIRKEGQNNFIIHRVEQGETLYALTRKYNTSLNDIRKANPGLDQDLNIGQEIRIPYSGQGNISSGKGRIEHDVRSGETLFSISRKYGVSINDIKNWNKRNSNTLAIGEKLVIYMNSRDAEKYNEFKQKQENNGKTIHIVNQGETLYSISEKYNVSPIDLKDWNRLEDNAVYVGQELIIGYADDKKVRFKNELAVDKEGQDGEIQVKTQDVADPDITTTISDDEYRKITQKGIARIIEGSEETKKYLAMHRDAPIGTIMKVKNEMNDLTVFVRVIGKLPETDVNRNVLLKISKTAYDRLGAFENQFPVEVTYHP